MKYLDEFRDPKRIKQTLKAIHRITTRNWRIMEICGGQTHAILKYGLQQLLPQEITLIHGPGCPVCVTPVSKIEAALQIASRPGVIFCSFGDMLRVPGNARDLLSLKAEGADIRTVYSPMDAVRIAIENPVKEIVFFAVGFETTIPTTAMAAVEAKKNGLTNFSLLVSHVLVPPAIEILLSAPDCHIQGFLAPGHVCTVTGTKSYASLSETYHVPIVVTGFEPLDLLTGIHRCVECLESGDVCLDNQYKRSVRDQGNPQALALMKEVYEVVDQEWRGIGVIPNSGLILKQAFRSLDAEIRFDVKSIMTEESAACISGLVLRGSKSPLECPSFGNPCTPESPLGAPMVSSEGACSAYYRYRRIHE